ncbi:hypothetical protein KIH77_01385 [Bifidobacterium sp. 82T24]|uniref:LpqB family beta-propeller domain-containing protein n=1 Tax=Bifidobacterium pluvialisilvae TaxID=2834436 RepID=UPI001C597054|nr:LpqB family beta-propeller domain-containing protein [Bifidobacterium pluvialisilvae]MBW3087400.1 hypothetical protein [Bifidobacterium pluvialisilvae]
MRRSTVPGRMVRGIASVCVGAMVLGLGACSLTLGLPTAGPVQRLSQVQREDHRVFIDPQGPSDDATPEEIVRGFLAALPAGPQTDGFKVARQFLTGSASKSWKPEAGVVLFHGEPDLHVGNANAAASSGKDGGRSQVDMSFSEVGAIDESGIFAVANASSSVHKGLSLVRSDGRWRIDKLPDGIMIEESDFQQVFRQVQLYQRSSSADTLVPDTRWFGWKQWRTLAVRELLDGAAPWLGDAVRPASNGKVRLAMDAVPSSGSEIDVKLSDAATLSSDERAMLVRQIRLTLGDGNDDYDLHITDSSGLDLSDADSHIKLDVSQPARHLYTLANRSIVSISSQNLIRLGEVEGGESMRSLAFTSRGGAVLDADGTVRCFDYGVSPCGTLFDGRRASAITTGIGRETWMTDGGSGLAVGMIDGGSERASFRVPWLEGRRVNALAVSPEGSRIVVAFDDGGDSSQMVMAGVRRDAENNVVGLSDTVTVLSRAVGVNAVTFYNDTTVVYSMKDSLSGYQQLAPGPETTQQLPKNTVALASAQIEQTLSLIALDDSGNVRYARGSLASAWRMLDLQTTAISSGV